MDCLVTKLKASVDADLPILGAILMKVNIPQDYSYGSETFFRCEPYSTDYPLTLSVIGDGYFRNKTSDTSLGKVMQVTTPKELCLSPGQYDVKIESKYDVGRLTFAKNFANAEFPLADLAFSKNLATIDFLGAPGVYGTMEKLCEGIFGLSRQSGSISMYHATDDITINGHAVGQYALTITFNSTGCTIALGVTTVATLVNGVWSYFGAFA